MPSDLRIKDRIFDFVERSGLEKLTDCQSGSWHLYILKELIDNALDADESHNNPSGIQVRFNYSANAGVLLIRVSNATPFPVEMLERIFSLRSYASSKDYVIGNTRGKQGNGLKTILGIPYALKYYFESTYQLDVPPLVIAKGETAYALSLNVDQQNQSIKLEKTRHKTTCTSFQCSIEVSLTHFRPAPPPNFLELESFAIKYALFNPDANFSWQIEIENETVQELDFQGSPPQREKTLAAPITWYRKPRYQRLLDNLIGQRGLRLSKLAEMFSGIADEAHGSLKRKLEVLHERFEANEVTWTSVVEKSFDAVVRATPIDKTRFQLSSLDVNQTLSLLSQHMDVEGSPIIKSVNQSDSTSSDPFMINVMIWRTSKVRSRTVSVGVNHSPLIKDPFYRKRFNCSLLLDSDQPMRLNECLDSCGIEKSDNVMVVIHIVAPTIEFQSFGKSEFDCRFLEDTLADTIVETAKEFCEANFFRGGEREICSNLPRAAAELKGNVGIRFSYMQLLCRAFELTVASKLIPSETPLPDINRFKDELLPHVENEYPSAFKSIIRNEKAAYLNPNAHSTILCLSLIHI